MQISLPCQPFFRDETGYKIFDRYSATKSMGKALCDRSRRAAINS